MTPALRIGTRRSQLALAQARWLANALEHRHVGAVELVEITTAGDRSAAPLAEVGGDGLFVGALRSALRDGDIDVAVHSYKDLPTAETEDLIVAAVPAREDPRDALVARDRLSLGELPSAARVGTGSPRRAAQLRALGLGLDVVPIRGNVDTRIRLVASGDLDAVVVARAGLARLGRLDEITETIDPLQMLPAPAQGALALEVRRDSSARRGELKASYEAIADLNDVLTRVAVDAERAVLVALEAGCSAPLGVLAEVAESDDGSEIYLRAVALATDGSRSVRCTATGPVLDPIGLGTRVARDLLERGAADLVSREPVSR